MARIIYGLACLLGGRTFALSDEFTCSYRFSTTRPATRLCLVHALSVPLMDHIAVHLSLLESSSSTSLTLSLFHAPLPHISLENHYWGSIEILLAKNH